METSTLRLILLILSLLLAATATYAQCAPLTVVSDTSWRLSTVKEDVGRGKVWQGASSLPADSTYTLHVSTGQPYANNTMKKVPGTDIIIAANKITFYRKIFDISDPDKVRMALQMTMDDGAEVYINGKLLVREDTSAPKNWKLPEHHILYDTTGTITNGYMGGQKFDYVKTLTLDTVLKAGTNQIVVAMFNLRAAHNKGGFSFKMSAYVVCEDDSACTSESLSVVSDSNWAESTQVDFYGSGDWTGAVAIPAEATFTTAVSIGQPYNGNSTSISLVPGTMPIRAANNVRYFKTVFNVTDPTDASARIRMYMDDGAEIYINGHLLAREENIDPQNFKGLHHDIMFSNSGTISNGFGGNQAFDWCIPAAKMDTILHSGANTLVVALRNLPHTSNQGGYSLRLDISNCGDTTFFYKVAPRAVISGVNVYPNPTTGAVTLNLPGIPGGGTHSIMLFDMNGRLLQKTSAESRIGGSSQDLELSYPAGLYILKVQSGETMSTTKLTRL